MTNPIPPFDHNLVIPPHKGDPTQRNELSPYPCTSIELCERFATSSERVTILENFIRFREELRKQGVVNGFQWIDGSFLEDIETREGRPPRDMDVVTVFWGLDISQQMAIGTAFPEFANPRLSKATYLLDHYPFDAGYDPQLTVEQSRYWVQLFSHNRLSVWKGMLQIDLNTPADDAQAMVNLSKIVF